MPRVLAATIVFVSLLTPAWWTAWDISKITPSLARLTLEGTEGTCTAFSIHEKRGVWVTMSHCLPDDLSTVRLNGDAKILEVLHRAPGDVAAAVIVADKGAPALKLGSPPKRGDDVLQIGYGGAAPVPIFYDGLLVAPSLRVETAEGEWDVQFNSAPGMPGMSGGPVIDRKYKVIGTVSGGTQLTKVPALLSFSPRYVEIRALIDKFGKNE